VVHPLPGRDEGDQVNVPLLPSRVGQVPVFGSFAPPPIPPDGYQVQKKYSLPTFRGDVFCLLRSKSGEEVRVELPVYEARAFDAGDIIKVTPTIQSREGRLDYGAFIPHVEVVYRAQVRVIEKTFDIGYMSKPKQVADGWVFFCYLEGDQSLCCDYDLAQAYFAKSTPVALSHYQALGVDRGASDKDIKRTYHRLARKYHPDIARDDGERFRCISEAYRVLSNSDERRRYDARSTALVPTTRRNWPGQGAGKLHCLAELRGDTWVVRQILSFARNRRVEKKQVDRVLMGPEGGTLRLRCRGEPEVSIPFCQTPLAPDTWRSKIQALGLWSMSRDFDPFYVVYTGVQRAKFNSSTRKPEFEWVEVDRRVEWPAWVQERNSDEH
jgi:curved DNA-binding protein CbpA